MVLIGVAEVDRIEPGHSPAPERRGDDPAAHAGVAHASAIVEQRVAVGQLQNDRQAMADRQHIALGEVEEPPWRANIQPGMNQPSSKHHTAHWQTSGLRGRPLFAASRRMSP